MAQKMDQRKIRFHTPWLWACCLQKRRHPTIVPKCRRNLNIFSTVCTEEFGHWFVGRILAILLSIQTGWILRRRLCGKSLEEIALHDWHRLTMSCDKRDIRENMLGTHCHGCLANFHVQICSEFNFRGRCGKSSSWNRIFLLVIIEFT